MFAILQRDLIWKPFVQFSKRFPAGFRRARWYSVIFSLLIGSSALYAQNVWVGPGPFVDESWFTPGNWTLGVPTNTQSALVDNGGIAIIEAPDGSGAALANTLTIGATVPGSTVQLLGTLTLGNPLIIGTNGTFRFSGGTLFGAGGAIQNNGTIVFDAQGGNQSLVHNITGSGTVTVNIGGGILAVSSNNTYSGATTVFAGTVQAASTTAFSPNSAFTLVANAIPAASPAPANPTLDLNGFNNTIGSLSGTGIVLNNGAATATLTVGNDNTSTTFGGVLEDGTSVLQLAKIGGGTLTLTGANTYTGGTMISAGILQIGNGGTTGSIAGNVIDNAVLAFDRSDSVAFGGAISGTGSVVNLGPGILTLTGTNTYSGGTTISAGTLQAGSATAFSPNSAFRVGSILDLNGFNNTIGSLSGNGTVLNNGATAATLTVGNDNTNTTFGGVLENGTSVLQLTKIGAGTLTLTGANTYTGGTTISAGTLQIGNGGTTGSIVGNVIDNATLAFDRSDSVTFGGAISGTGSVVKLGPGTLTLTGANTYTGGTMISAGILQIGNGGTTGSIAGNVIDNAVLAFDRSDSVTFGGAISGTGSVVNLGPGILTLTGTNTYSGGTTISAGTLQAGSATAFSPNSAFRVGSILDLNGFNNTIGSLSGNGTVLNNGATAATLTVGNDNTNTTFGGVLENGTSVLQLTKIGAGTLTLTGANTYTGGTTISAGTLQIGNGGTTGSIVGNVIDNATLAFDRSDSVTFGGAISGTGSVVKLGPGTLTLTGANTYTGGTMISAGILQIGNGGTTGSIAGNVIDNAVLAFDRSDSVTFGGAISGTGSVVNLGPGILTLTGTNTYSGGTTISAGTLQAGSATAF